MIIHPFFFEYKCFGAFFGTGEAISGQEGGSSGPMGRGTRSPLPYVGTFVSFFLCTDHILQQCNYILLKKYSQIYLIFGKVWLDIIKQKDGSSASLLYFLNAERGHGRRGHVLSCC